MRFANFIRLFLLYSIQLSRNLVTAEKSKHLRKSERFDYDYEDIISHEQWERRTKKLGGKSSSSGDDNDQSGDDGGYSTNDDGSSGGNGTKKKKKKKKKNYYSDDKYSNGSSSSGKKNKNKKKNKKGYYDDDSYGSNGNGNKFLRYIRARAEEAFRSTPVSWGREQWAFFIIAMILFGACFTTCCLAFVVPCYCPSGAKEGYSRMLR